MTVAVPTSYVYTDAPAPQEMKIRLLGVDSATSHKSECQLGGWKKTVNSHIDVYNRSPMAAIQDGLFSLHESTFTQKLAGLHTDHAEDQKKLFRIMKEWKLDSSKQALGSDYLLQKDPADLQIILSDAKNQLIAEVGGMDVWESFSLEEQKDCTNNMLWTLAAQYGNEVYEKLTPEQQRQHDLMYWAGCCMHKELNAVKGGTVAIGMWWKDNDIEGPKILFNKDNEATLSHKENPEEELTSAERRAIEVSTSGAVKFCSLMGALLNHKDDKKGQHDTYRNHFQKVKGRAINFPDTSNTRYQSYLHAAAEVISNLDLYREFVLLIKDIKEKRNFNHLEKNVYEALYTTKHLLK